MALIVEGNMPTCCGLCCDCLGGGSDAYYCNRAKKQISEVVPPYDKRMEWCPFVGEMPDKHGRLVDIDRMIREARKDIIAMAITDTEELADFLETYADLDKTDHTIVVEASTEEGTNG